MTSKDTVPVVALGITEVPRHQPIFQAPNLMGPSLFKLPNVAPGILWIQLTVLVLNALSVPFLLLGELLEVAQPALLVNIKA